MGFQEIIGGLGAFYRGYSNGQRLQMWLQLPENQALNAIETFVSESRENELIDMEDVFCGAIGVAFQIDQKRELAKYFAFFRICEFNKTSKFRSFRF